MTAKNIWNISIKSADKEAYNLATVTANPRMAGAKDLQVALENLIIEAPPELDGLPLAVVRYLFHDYFFYAHQSGLYNRQIRLWEMFSRVVSVEVRQWERGFFTRVALPVYEIVMKTSQGQNPVCALVIDRSILANEHYKSQANQTNGAGKIYVEFLREFLLKVMKIQARLGSNGVKGIFVVTRGPLEPALLAMIEKETGASDPVSRVESIMPAPVSSHINLLTYDKPDHDGESSGPVISLAYPKIVRKTAAASGQ